MSRVSKGLAGAALSMVALVVWVTPQAVASAERVFVQRVPGAEQKLYYRPHVFYLSADGALTLTGVKWHSYDGSTATASAVAHTNGCDPFCLAGTFTTHPTKLRLSGRTYCRVRGREIYTRLRIHILGRIPDNFGNGRQSLSMRPVDVDGDPVC